jgi:hypothetical protein
VERDKLESGISKEGGMSICMGSIEEGMRTGEGMISWRPTYFCLVCGDEISERSQENFAVNFDPD